MSGNAWRIIAGAAGAAMLAVQAAAADDLQTCEDESGDVAIAACTRVIASATYGGDNLATLYSNRGVEHMNKGDLDRAIADYDQAIKLDPKDTSAYYNRAHEEAHVGKERKEKKKPLTLSLLAEEMGAKGLTERIFLRARQAATRAAMSQSEMFTREYEPWRS
jgi:tetratricopeptide (TPR) repeat protein